MKKSILSATLVSGLSLGLSFAGYHAVLAQDETNLRDPAEFSHMESEEARAVALFEEMGKVITHPRCMNCHPRNDIPRQGDDMVEHKPPVIRYDEAGMGAPGMRCSTCHGAENVAFVTGEGSIPGHEPWHLAPQSMGWIGLSLGEICEQLKDPARNGDRTLAEIQEHNAEDGLVGWGWEPGEDREKVPGTQEQFGKLTQAWIDAGAACPTT